MDFQGKVIIITGASSGIGADAARHLANLGGKIALVGRNKKRLNEVAEQIEKDGNQSVLAIVADVTKDAQRIIDETIDEFGRLDVLVNNAGFFMGSDTAANIEISDFDSIMDTNLRAIIILTNLAVPHLEKTKGNIVNVSSILGRMIIPGFTSYSVSKAALDQFTKCSALDLAPKGIRVNAINPAVIRTSIFESAGLTKQETDKTLETFNNLYPVGRAGKLEDTSNAIAYLASEKGSFLTGILLPVDGGYLTGTLQIS